MSCRRAEQSNLSHERLRTGRLKTGTVSFSIAPVHYMGTRTAVLMIMSSETDSKDGLNEACQATLVAARDRKLSVTATSKKRHSLKC
jgi:hypothetical protein